MKHFFSGRTLLFWLRFLAALFFLLPPVWILGAALHPAGVPLPTSLRIFPQALSLDNFAALGDYFPLARFTLNSLWITATGVLLTLITASLVAFAIALLPRRLHQTWIILLLAVMLVPDAALWPARFFLYKAISWIDTPMALVAPALIGTSPFYILMYYRAYRRVPREVFEVARIDGAGILQTWWYVALPVVRPTTLGVALLSFVLFWGDYTSPLLYLTTERFATLPVALQSLAQLSRSDWALLMAGVAAAMIVPLGLFLIMMPYFNRLSAPPTLRKLLAGTVSRKRPARVRQALLPILLFVFFPIMLAACRPGVDPAATVRFMVFGDPAEYRAYQELVEAFHTHQSQVRIVLTNVPSAADYRARLATDYAAGSPPDISLMNYRRYASFAAKGVLEPLGPYLDRSEVISRIDFYPITLEAFTWQGSLICIPQNISSLVVYYNRDLFDQAGLPYPSSNWDWDGFTETAKALTRDLDGDGQVDQYGLGVEPSLFRLAPFIWQNEAPLADDLYAPTRLTLTRPPSLAALEWFVGLRQVHQVVPGRVEEAAQDSESRFIAGTTAMFLNSRRGTPTYREIKTFRWDIAPLPGGKVQAGILHSDAYCLSANAENKDAAWQFIEFANSLQGQSIIARSGRTVPSLIEAAESEAFLQPGTDPERAEIFLDTISTLKLVPVISTWEEIERVASLEIERAFYGEISAEEAASLAVLRTEEYFKLAEFAIKP
jgi:multiple sugar transport system substrate-binding protein